MNADSKSEKAIPVAEYLVAQQRAYRNFTKILIVVGSAIVVTLAVNFRFSFPERKLGEIVFTKIQHDNWTGKNCILFTITGPIDSSYFQMETDLPMCEK